MKLSTYAKKNGISYMTAWRWYHNGSLQGKQMPSGTIIVAPSSTSNNSMRVAIYARVSSSQNKDNLDSQAIRLQEYATAKGYTITHVIKEIGSGLNDNRPKLLDTLKLQDFDILLVEHSDRLTRFGAKYIESLLNLTQRRLEIVNVVDTDEQDIIQDFVSVITSFCARIYGRRRSKRNTEKLIKELNQD